MEMGEKVGRWEGREVKIVRKVEALQRGDRDPAGHQMAWVET